MGARDIKVRINQRHSKPISWLTSGQQLIWETGSLQFECVCLFRDAVR